MKKQFNILGIILTIILVPSCEKKSVPPSLSTTTVTEISTTTAVSGGSITDDGGASIVSRGVCWNTSDDPTIESSKTTENVDLLSFTSNITQLSPNTSYYVRAYATNSVGTGYGKSVSFRTQGDKPAPNTLNTSNITINSATLNGSVNPNFLSTTVTFEYGVSTSYGSTAPALESPVPGDTDGNVTVKADLTGLNPGTTYHFRVKATNVLGTTNGDDVTFKTLGAVPTVKSEPAQNVKITSATLEASVNPNYLPTDFFFEFGTSTSYGSLLPASQYPFSGGEFIGTSCVFTGLTAETTYHYRVIAENELGKSIGEDVAFTTYSAEDADQNYYHSVTIGTQVWLDMNLKNTHFNNGTAIPEITNNSEWSNLTISAYCWYNNDETANKNTYGALYNWYAVNTGNLCPTGWHVPSDVEWTTLIDFLGGNSVAGTKLKETGTLHWIGSNPNATNVSGFTTLPAGDRGNSGFGNLTLGAYFWHSTEYSIWGGQITYIQYPPTADILPFNKEYGASVRCLKN